MEGVFLLIHGKNILVCVTQQKTCERLIRKAAEMKGTQNLEFFVIHVAKNSWSFLGNDKEGEALEYLFGISKSVGAYLTVLRSDNIVETISEFSIENNIGYIVMGQSPNDHSENNFYTELKNLLPNAEICIVPQQDI
jgi:K+-sensing histidine kinase KdpD